MQRVLWPNILFGGVFFFSAISGAVSAPLGKEGTHSASKAQSSKSTPVISPAPQSAPASRPAPTPQPALEYEQSVPPIPLSNAQSDAPPAQPDVLEIIRDTRKPILITREDIERHYGYDIAQLLQAYLNLDIRRVGGAGAQSELFFQGAEQRQIAIYVDDTRVSDRTLNNRLQTDHVQGGLPWHMLPLSQIGWIEIREGMEATRQGEGAIAASVHIYTRRPLHEGSRFGGVVANHGSQGIEFGYNSSETNAFVDMALTHHEGISATNPRGLSSNNDRDGALDFSARAGYQGKWSDTSLFDLMAMAVNSQNKFDQGESATNWQLAQAKIATLSNEARWHQQFRAAAWHKLTTYTDTSDHRLRTVHGEITWDNRLRIGAQSIARIDTHFRADAARWTSIDNPRPKLGTKSTTNAGIGVTFDFPIRQNLIEMSALYDHHAPFGDISTYGIRWEKDIIPAKFHTSAEIHSGYAAPTLEDRYSTGESGGIDSGSPEATFEKSTQFNTNLRYRFDMDHEAELLLYGSRIDAVLTRSGTGFVLSNGERYDLSGARLSYRYRESDWQFRLIGNLQSAMSRKGALPYRPDRKLLVALSKRVGGGYALEGTARMVDARKTPQGELEPYAIFDFSAIKNFAREYDISVVFSNLLDKPYETEYGFNMPGRTILLHFRYTPRG